MMNFENMHIWCGTKAGYDQVMHLFMAALGNPQTMLAVGSYGQQEDPKDTNPVEITMHGNVAILNVAGPMISDASPMSRYFGIVAYSDITERLYQLGDAPGQAKVALINWNTTGGAAIGMGGTSRTIRAFSDSTMPVISYTDRVTMSAGYWLAAAGAKFYAGEDAQIGSVGAICFHSEFSKAREMAGITDTVIRSNANKCLVNQIEPLSDKGRAELQADADKWQALFAGGIAELRNMPVKQVNDTIANGKVYDTADAIKLNMVDGSASFEQVIAKLSKGVK